MKITGPGPSSHHCSQPQFTFLLLLLLVPFYLLRWSFVNDKPGGIDNSSVLVGSKVVCCVQVRVKRQWHLVYLFESYWRQTLVSLLREICHYLHQPSTWGNQRGGVIYTHQPSSQFLAPLTGTPVYKIGELHAIFYLCFLVLLVYLSVFTFVSLIKNTKNTCCYYGFQLKHQVVWLH